MTRSRIANSSSLAAMRIAATSSLDGTQPHAWPTSLFLQRAVGGYRLELVCKIQSFSIAMVRRLVPCDTKVSCLHTRCRGHHTKCIYTLALCTILFIIVDGLGLIDALRIYNASRHAE